jgi:hypothetical protein
MEARETRLDPDWLQAAIIPVKEKGDAVCYASF